MIKKVFALFVLVGVLTSLSAQRVNETVVLFGKDQLTGFTINISNGTPKEVNGALSGLFESRFKMKSSKKKGYYVYENYPCSAFGDARYDIYFTSAEIGKKKNKATQLTLVVSTGNLNCITYSNDPRTSRNITAFLENFPPEVEIYKTNLRIEQLKKELNNLEKERQNLEKERNKTKDKLANMNNDLRSTAEMAEKKNDEINKLQEKFTESHDETLKIQIDEASKERLTLQKAQSSMQKSVLKMNNDLNKLEKKIEENKKNASAKESELKSLQ